MPVVGGEDAHCVHVGTVDDLPKIPHGFAGIGAVFLVQLGGECLAALPERIDCCDDAQPGNRFVGEKSIAGPGAAADQCEVDLVTGGGLAEETLFRRDHRQSQGCCAASEEGAPGETGGGHGIALRLHSSGELTSGAGDWVIPSVVQRLRLVHPLRVL